MTIAGQLNVTNMQQPSWSNLAVDPPATNQTLQVYKDPTGRVYLRGYFTSTASLAASGDYFNVTSKLPQQFRPAVSANWVQTSGSGLFRVNVPGGNDGRMSVSYLTGTNGVTYFMDGSYSTN